MCQLYNNRSKNLPKQNPDSMSSGKKEDTSKAKTGVWRQVGNTDPYEDLF